MNRSVETLSPDDRQLKRDIAWAKDILDDASRSKETRSLACKLMNALVAQRTPERVRMMEWERGISRE